VTVDGNDNDFKGETVMARIIEFHIPANFKPKIKWMPPEERGRLVLFPGKLKRSA
jgi:hypothetical protein